MTLVILVLSVWRLLLMPGPVASLVPSLMSSLVASLTPDNLNLSSTTAKLPAIVALTISRTTSLVILPVRKRPLSRLFEFTRSYSLELLSTY